MEGENFMDQEKIGKFISKLRKEKNMTQEQLAEKLGISAKSISRWETGRNMPDLSLLQSLCEILGVSINELLNGERIKENEYQGKLEQNIIKTIDYTSEKINKTTKKVRLVTIILFAVIFSTVILGGLFCIDVNRMKNNKPVFFSTWGLKYAPPVQLDDEEIEIAIKDYLVKNGDSEIKYHDNQKTFVSIRPYLFDEKEEKLFYVYAWVLEKQCYLENDEIKEDSGYSIPHKFVVEFIDNQYVVTDSRIPRDGSYYVEDMKNIFPSSVRKNMDNVYYDGTMQRLELDIQEQMKLYFHQ